MGLWYTGVSFLFFLFAGVLAMLIRAQLAVPDNDFLSAETYNQVFTLHGSVMMFLFGVPIFEAFSILILPQMLGARDLPFPRLSAYGFWCFIIGGVFVCGSIFFGVAPQGGWFMSPPLTTTYQDGLGADIWLLGLSFIEVSSIAAAVELIVGVLKTRPPGMRINLIPLYSWYILVVAGMILFAFPPLIAGDLLFELERAFDWPFFDASRGGDPLLWQHLFWIFGHPEVYIIFLPAVALVATIVPTAAGRPIVGYSFIVLAAVGTGFISFGLWVHHMFTTGMPVFAELFFMYCTMLIAVPTGVKVFNWVATMWRGALTFETPMLFAIAFIVLFTIGGLSGLMLAIVPADFQYHDTYFVVAHFHYVLVTGAVFSIMAAAYYWLPKWTGHMYDHKLSLWHFWTSVVSVNVLFFPMHFLGLAGMPRRIPDYAIQFADVNQVVSIGGFAFGLSQLIFLWLVIKCVRGGETAPSKPWDRAEGLEWTVPSPAPHHTFTHPPKVD